VGQLLLKLYRVGAEADAKVVTFFLDELPRLGRLDVIEQSLDMGRGYGVRLWLFCQNLGQLQTAYPNAQGMMSNCAIRCFMNPDEDAARWLAENLGTRHGLLDGNRKQLVEAHQLTGPDFANQVVVFSRGQLPARLDKKPAYADSNCQERIAGVAQRRPEAIAEPDQETSGTVSSVVHEAEAASPEPVPDTDQVAPVQETTAPEPVQAADESASNELVTEAPKEAAQTAPVNWDDVRTATPAILLATPARVERKGPGDWRYLAAGIAFFLVAGVTVRWFAVQSTEIETLRAEKASLSAEVKAAEGASERIERERAAWKESLRVAEAAREKFRG
jgi:hypothetical protein